MGEGEVKKEGVGGGGGGLRTKGGGGAVPTDLWIYSRFQRGEASLNNVRGVITRTPVNVLVASVVRNKPTESNRELHHT